MVHSVKFIIVLKGIVTEANSTKFLSLDRI